jgi:hypothetical protein
MVEVVAFVILNGRKGTLWQQRSNTHFAPNGHSVSLYERKR